MADLHRATALLQQFKAAVDAHNVGPAPRALIELQTQLKVRWPGCRTLVRLALRFRNRLSTPTRVQVHLFVLMWPRLTHTSASCD